MSAAVVWRPRLKRRLARASSGGKPMAVRTWDGSTAPEEQAAPVETARPFKSSEMRRASPSTPGKTIFVVFGVRGAAPPLARDCGTRCSKPCCNLSRSAEMRWASSTRDLRAEEHTSELQSHLNLVCRLLLEKK